jgi:hypothetical protein
LQCERFVKRAESIAAALVIASCLPAAAEDALGLREIITLPCRTYLATYGHDVYPYLTGPVVEYFTAVGDLPAAFGSACNVANYVRSECLLHPMLRLGEAMYTLALSARLRRPLPQIPQCSERSR